MYKVYIIDFASRSKDLPNASLSTKFRQFAQTPNEGAAWAMSKSLWIEQKKKTVIISPDGVPIGGY